MLGPSQSIRQVWETVFLPVVSERGLGFGRELAGVQAVVGGPALDKPSQEPLGLGAGRRLQRVGARGTVGVGFHSNQ